MPATVQFASKLRGDSPRTGLGGSSSATRYRAHYGIKAQLCLELGFAGGLSRV